MKVALVWTCVFLSFFFRSQCQDWDDVGESEDHDTPTETLTILTNEIVRLKTELKELKNVMSKGTRKSQSKFSSIIAATRTIYPQKNLVIFTVTYKNQSNILFSEWHRFQISDYSYNNIMALNNTSSWIKPNVVSSLTIPLNDTDHVVFSLTTSKTIDRIFLNAVDVENANKNKIVVTDIKPPILETVPDGDFVYKMGKNLSVSFLHPRQENIIRDPGSLIMEENREVSKQLVYLDAGKRNGTGPISWDDFRSTVAEKKFLEEIELDVELNTAAMNVSGLLIVSSGRNELGDFVKRTERQMIVVVRPSTQQGPFPADKIYAVGAKSSPELNDVFLDKYCTIGNPCYVHCGFYGNKIKRIKMLKMVNGSTHRISFMPNSDDNLYYKNAVYHFQPDEKDGPSLNFTCRAWNKNGVRRVIRTHVVIGVDVKVIEESSYVKSFDNGTAEVVCAAQGRPLPSFTIQCGGPVDEPDPIIVNQTDSMVTTKVLCPKISPPIRCLVSNNYKSDYLTLSTLTDDLYF